MAAMVEPRLPDQRRGWLKNNNPPGDLLSAPRCGARNRAGLPCRCPAMKNGRCQLHGGKSTGPKTEEGRQRIAQAQFKHGRYSKAAKAERRSLRELLIGARTLLAEFGVRPPPRTKPEFLPDLRPE